MGIEQEMYLIDGEGVFTNRIGHLMGKTGCEFHDLYNYNIALQGKFASDGAPLFERFPGKIFRDVSTNVSDEERELLLRDLDSNQKNELLGIFEWNSYSSRIIGDFCGIVNYLASNSDHSNFIANDLWISSFQKGHLYFDTSFSLNGLDCRLSLEAGKKAVNGRGYATHSSEFRVMIPNGFELPQNLMGTAYFRSSRDGQCTYARAFPELLRKKPSC